MPGRQGPDVQPMCPISHPAIVYGMTGNQVLDIVLIAVAAVFFVAGAVFLPLWEFTQGRGDRDSHGQEQNDHQSEARAAA